MYTAFGSVQTVEGFMFAALIKHRHCAYGRWLTPYSQRQCVSELSLEKFCNMQCIFITCGRATGLLVDDIRRVCPSVRMIVHSNWLMINGQYQMGLI